MNEHRHLNDSTRPTVHTIVRVLLILAALACQQPSAPCPQPAEPEPAPVRAKTGKVVLEGTFYRSGEAPPFTFWLRTSESEGACAEAVTRYADGAPPGLTFSCREEL